MAKARVLAIDDQAYYRELIEGLLSKEGFEVVTAESGEAGLRELERADFDVVLMDLVMTGLDGAALVQKMLERVPGQAIIVIAGVVDVRTATEAIKLGAADLLLKPFDQQDLSRVLDKVTRHSQLQTEHTRLMQENLGFMGALSLFERAMGFFGTLAAEPLSARILEALCLETQAQSGVLWIDPDGDGERFEIAGAQGGARIELEAETILWEDFSEHEGAALVSRRSSEAGDETDTGSEASLLLVLRCEGQPLGIVKLFEVPGEDGFAAEARQAAEKISAFGALALRNALRFRQLERRSLRDPETQAYTLAYFEDTVRNEIQKATRFGHRFSLLRVDLDTDGAAPETADANAFAEIVQAALRGTDVLAARDAASFSVLLPQTDALGAGILAQRIRKSLAGVGRENGSALRARVTAATFPVDGTQFRGLRDVLEQRIERSRVGLLREQPGLAEAQPIDGLLDRMLELGEVESVEMEGQIFRFVLEDVARRPADRGVLFVSPGARWLTEVLETIHTLQDAGSRTELVIVAEAEGQAAGPRLTWATKTVLDARRPFLVYFGDGPAFAMIGQVTCAGAQASVFQTCDRALVEHLAFELQRELGIQLSV